MRLHLSRLAFEPVNKKRAVTWSTVTRFAEGVNLHEFNQTTGQVITEADVTRDMERMKQLHVNAIRLSHYPQPSFLYDLADNMAFTLWMKPILNHMAWVMIVPRKKSGQ